MSKLNQTQGIENFLAGSLIAIAFINDSLFFISTEGNRISGCLNVSPVACRA